MDSIRGEFIITNLTDNVIKVLATDRDCTCSGVKVSSNEIQPQKTITLIMSVAIKNNSSIDTNSILVLNTKQKFYKFKIKGDLISKTKAPLAAGKNEPPGLPTQGKVLFFFDVAGGGSEE
jgi:hypothetical protein